MKIYNFNYTNSKNDGAVDFRSEINRHLLKYTQFEILQMYNIKELNDKKINDYKKKYPEELSDSFKKMHVLKSMLDAGLITLQEYSIKRESILKSI